MDNKTNKMLIDATHPEETRVVVLRNGRVEEFDYESAARKLLRGNIYLAKVTRVEPSLQAAFVEYGGNRHGFLAFNEIHPDYYQIPMSDRQALIEEEAAAEAEADAEADARAERKYQGNGDSGRRRDGARDGGREGGRDGGRNRNRNRSNQNGNRGAGEEPQPPGIGEQPGGSSQLSAETAHDGSHAVAGSEPVAEHGHAESSHVHSHDQSPDHAPDHGHDHTGAAEAPHHDHHDHDDALDRHVAAVEQPSTLPEATGHTDDRVTETYAPYHHEGHADHSHDHGPDHAEGTVASHAHEAHEADYAEPDRAMPEIGDRPVAGHIEEVPEVTEAPETIGAGADADVGGDDDGVGEVQERPRRQRRRQYKIQEVIKRRQVILIQVVKEERGNKGAALTTYLSLAGRYTVLMPNTGRGGGISRKIVTAGDRKRLKSIAQELDVPEGMGLIIRTAGAARTSQEIKRDYEYLLRLWESVREMTLQSTAPSLVYEEGNLIKRSIRDLYSKEIDEVVVAGEQAYTDAADFMRMLMPSHVKNVIKYNQPEALFTRYPIEKQLNAMFSPYVTLKSGGYLVINQTEALVSIDVNSGKSTREYSIEETALATNLEASDEIARQLKLRDLAGLIVIDFIDMEEKRNNRKVEHRLTDALRFDRARIQVGRISHFGLMEMSRQRMRTGVLEGSTSQCPHCQGTGMIRSVESVALAVLRGLEDHLVKDPRSSVNVMTTATVALYILNNKRSFITEIEGRYGVSVAVQASDKMQGANFVIERSSAAPVHAPRPAAQRTAVSMDWGFDGEEANEAEVQSGLASGSHDHAQHGHQHDAVDGADDESGDGQQTQSGAEGGQEGGRQGRRRRRRRGRDRGDRPAQPTGNDQQNGHDGGHDQPGQASHPAHAEGGHAGEMITETSDQTGAGDGGEHALRPESQRDEGDQGARRGRRRGRRGGRRNHQRDDVSGTTATDTGATGELSAEGDALLDDIAANDDAPDGQAPMAPAPHAGAHDAGHGSSRDGGHDTAVAERSQSRQEIAAVPARTPEPQPAETALALAEPAAEVAAIPVSRPPEAPEDPTRPRRRGWWNRRGLGE